MSTYYGNPALDAELSYRRELLQAAGRANRTRRGQRFPRRRRTAA